MGGQIGAQCGRVTPADRGGYPLTVVGGITLGYRFVIFLVTLYSV